MAEPSPPRARAGRYDNPYIVAEWHHDLPTGTQCTPYRLVTDDRGAAHGWLYHRGGERTVVCLMHPRADFAQHYATPGLLDAGLAVFCENSRWLNNDSMLQHEVVLLDVAAGISAMRRRFDRVVLCGNSGGGSLFTLYTAQALALAGTRLRDTAAGDPFDLNRFELPAPDAMVYLAAHPGEGHYLLSAIDASVTDEHDPVSCDPALDPYGPDNGFAEPPAATRYAPAFVGRYRAAQRARVARIDDVARRRVERRREARADWRRSGSVVARRASIATHFLTVFRTDADLRCVDRSLDPSARDYGSLWGVRPDWINYGAVGFARVVAPEAWLSTWSGLSSRADISRTGPGMTLPALMVSYTGDNCIFPSDDELLASSLGTAHLDRVSVPGDHYGFPAASGRDVAVRAVADWSRATP